MTIERRLSEAEAENARLRTELDTERRRRREVERSADVQVSVLREKLAMLERTRAAAALEVRESTALASTAIEGDVMRHRVSKLEFGVGYLEVGEVPHDATIVVRVPPGSSSGRVMPVLRELANLVADGGVPLTADRGAWELVRRAAPAAANPASGRAQDDAPRARTRHRDLDGA